MSFWEKNRKRIFIFYIIIFFLTFPFYILGMDKFNGYPLTSHTPTIYLLDQLYRDKTSLQANVLSPIVTLVATRILMLIAFVIAMRKSVTSPLAKIIAIVILLTELLFLIPGLILTLIYVACGLSSGGCF